MIFLFHFLCFGTEYFYGLFSYVGKSISLISITVIRVFCIYIIISVITVKFNNTTTVLKNSLTSVWYYFLIPREHKIELRIKNLSVLLAWINESSTVNYFRFYIILIVYYVNIWPCVVFNIQCFRKLVFNKKEMGNVSEKFDVISFLMEPLVLIQM